MLTCANCGTDNEATRKFCLECGQRLGVVCPTCGTQNSAAAKFCGECGAGLDGGGQAATPMETASAATPTGSEPVAERRLVSVLFVDLVGFTSDSEQRDAEDTRELLSRYFELARETVDRHGGVIEKFIGDAVMAIWGTPTAHEDDAERAVRTALELVSGVAGLEGAIGLRARAGVLTGEAAVTIGAEGQGMVAGDMVNTASRLQSAAEPGTVLVGEATHRAASGAITFEELEPLALKGKEELVRAWRAVAVVGRRGGQGRAAALEPPFVGRDEELRLLKEQFHATAREGKPRLVTIIGQAGIGKSRLAWELEKYLDGVVETVLWHEGRSPSYGEGISYWALAEIVRGRAGIAESEEADAARTKVTEMLAGLPLQPAEQRWIEPRLTGLLGLDELPGESREELFAAWRTFFERLGQQGTVMLVLWDLQWADQGLLDFVEHLLTWARSSPIFVLAEARPELFERRPGWGSNVRTATSVHLEPLSDEDMRRLLTGIAQGMPEQALRAIIERAEGVPLYAVETIRMLLDRGALVPEGDQLRMAGELPPLSVPETLHALIAARLDALGPEERAVVTDAAVLGLSFTVGSLEGITGLAGPAIAQHLDDLVRREFMILDADPLSAERGQYRFIQGVVREVAYQSLAKRDRRAKHLAAARYFEALGEDELAGVLASHYLAAYRASPSGEEADALAVQARLALRAAADRATALHAPHGALEYLEQALEVTSDPLEQAALHERAAAAAATAAQLDVADQHALKAIELYTAQRDRLGVLRGHTARAYVKLSEHGDHTAIEILREALSNVDDLPSGPEIVEAQSELARALMLQASPEALVWSDRVLENPAAVNQRVLINTLITRGSILQYLGRLTESEALLRGSVILADRLGDPTAMLRARNNMAGIIEGQSLAGVLDLARECMEIAQRFGERTWVQQAIGLGLFNGFESGQWDAWADEAAAELPEAATFYRHWVETERARRLAYRGRTEEALQLMEEALADESIRSSAQAMAGMAGLTAEVRFTEGRWLDAFEASRPAWTTPDTVRVVTQLAQFSAAAAGDAARLAEAVQAQAHGITEDTLLSQADRYAGAALTALVGERWDDARLAYVQARRLFDETGAAKSLALLRLTVGQLAAGRFPEADAAIKEADAFFSSRGADPFLAAYRANAFRPSSGKAPSARPLDAGVAEPEPSSR